MQVDASLQNQNLRTDLRWVAKLIRKSALKFTQVAKSRNIKRIYRWSTRVGWPKGKNLHWLAFEFELDQSQHKPSQVGGQTKRKLDASRNVDFGQDFSSTVRGNKSKTKIDNLTIDQYSVSYKDDAILKGKTSFRQLSFLTFLAQYPIHPKYTVRYCTWLHGTNRNYTNICTVHLVLHSPIHLLRRILNKTSKNSVNPSIRDVIQERWV